MRFRRITRSFRLIALKNEIGASLVEYALLIALIATVAMSSVTLLGRETAREYNCVAIELNNPSIRAGIIPKIDDDDKDYEDMTVEEARFVKACL